MKKAVLGLSLLLVGACAVHEGRQTPALQAGQQAKAQEAARLLSQANYAAFKKAFHLYAELSSQAGLSQPLAHDYLNACFLLGVREKDLGIFDPAPLDTAERLIATNPKLAGEESLLEVARLLSHRSRGIVGDVDLQVQKYFDQSDALARLVTAAAAGARTDPVAACVLAEFESEYDWFIESHKLDLKVDDLLAAFPGSPLLLFVKATGNSREDEKLLQEILARDPDCREVYYFLGNISLTGGLLLEAEGRFEKAFEAIPESPQITISLAGVSFAEEEFERSIDFYDKTLALMPGYREAILGKAISLTYLGRNVEAMTLLDKLISLGNYLMGESHFWLASNLNDLKRFTEAQEHIEQAKKLLGQGQVYTLSGLIDLGLDQDARAKADFLEALKFNAADAEALLNLGGIFGRQQVWDKSGSYAQKAGDVYEAQAASLRDKLADVKASSLPEARKARLLQRKSAQLNQALLSGATAYYNAGAAYLNAGDAAKARPCLVKAASYPALKDKAEELASRIKFPA